MQFRRMILVASSPNRLANKKESWCKSYPLLMFLPKSTLNQVIGLKTDNETVYFNSTIRLLAFSLINSGLNLKMP